MGTEGRLQGQAQQKPNSSATRDNPLIVLLSRFLRERERVEWIGDLYEMRRQWQGQGLTPPVINLRVSGVVLQLLLTQLHCAIYDWVFTRYWGKP